MNFDNRTILLAAAATIAVASPAWAQSGAASDNDIVVTARRVEERLQDVPISITVLNSAAIANNNITSAKDLTTYTPGLLAQGRYGNDNVAFTIRGFSQEQRSTATVGTYFADVVMPRGSGASQGGDGAGPGQLFDLENVQVLKGPQGTLQGRNSTGGAVLLVPKKPTDQLEGYIEGSIGDYGMRRVQAVVNLPLAETFRVRLGVDRNKRDGYLKNIGNLGTGQYGKDMGSTDYWAFRGSIVGDLTPDIENYTIFSYVKSKATPSIPKMITAWANGPGLDATGRNPIPCSSAATSLWCAQFAREAAYGPWTVSNSMADTASLNETWQVINTTKWQVSDTLTIKNILAYAELRTTNNMDLFGNYLLVDGTPYGTERADQVLTFAYTHDEATSGRSNAESTFVEELQFQGNSANNRLQWQAGFYLEMSDPLGYSGVQTAIQTPCLDINTFACRTATGRTSASIFGTGSLSIASTKFRNTAVYGQASYDLTDKLKLTVGGRYTWDKMSTELNNLTWVTAPAAPGGAVFRCSNLTAPGYAGTTTFPISYANRLTACGQNLSQKTSAPTWLLGLDFKPIENALLYAKWSRGYRQGGLTIFGADPIQGYNEEKVDTYEIGTKVSWRGPVPGNFNLSAYYNDFADQQLQASASCDPAVPGFTVGCGPTTAIVNAGKSRLYGFEAELGISPFDGLKLQVAYAYLKSKITEIPTAADLRAQLAGSPYNNYGLPLVGDELNFAMRHKLTANANFTLPLPESFGRLSVGGTFVYQSRYRAVADFYRSTGNGIIPGASFGNVNVTWENVAQLPIDASFFVTNVTNEVVYTHLNDQQSRNNISAMLAEPRMWGARLRYKFGQ